MGKRKVLSYRQESTYNYQAQKNPPKKTKQKTKTNKKQKTKNSTIYVLKARIEP